MRGILQGIYFAPMAENPLHNLPYQVTAAIQQGNLIEAIKQLRQHKPQLGLAEAKALIEALQKQAQGGNVKAAVKTQAKAAMKTAAAKGMAPHGPAHSHVPPPEGMPPPGSNLSVGEVPRTAGGPAFLVLIVAIGIVVFAAVYFNR
jgi:hypothetical protein